MTLSANTSIEPSLDRYRDALLTSPKLSAIPNVRHGITGRIPGLAPAEANIGYGAPRDRDAAWIERQRWSNAAGINPLAISTVHQVHGRGVVRVDFEESGRGGPLGSSSLGQADALMTNSPGVAVMTLHADCLPIILVDPGVLAVCVIHSGWRGTVADVPGAAIAAMVEQFGASPERIVAMIGPGIRSCCYEVGDEVIAGWREVAGDSANESIEVGPRRWHLDLPKANRWLLMRAGISPEHIDDQALCTRCNGDQWFSHRGQGPETGRFAAMVGIAPATSEESDSWF